VRITSTSTNIPLPRRLPWRPLRRFMSAHDDPAPSAANRRAVRQPDPPPAPVSRHLPVSRFPFSRSLAVGRGRRCRGLGDANAHRAPVPAHARGFEGRRTGSSSETEFDSPTGLPLDARRTGSPADVAGQIEPDSRTRVIGQCGWLRSSSWTGTTATTGPKTPRAGRGRTDRSGEDGGRVP